jgi:hypothetical protein
LPLSREKATPVRLWQAGIALYNQAKLLEKAKQEALSRAANQLPLLHPWSGEESQAQQRLSPAEALPAFSLRVHQL